MTEFLLIRMSSTLIVALISVELDTIWMSQLGLAVNALCKYSSLKYQTYFWSLVLIPVTPAHFTTLSLTKKLYFWNTTVSENCCLSCNKTVYKHDSVISSSELEDKCQTTEKSICRILPGKVSILHVLPPHEIVIYLNCLTFLEVWIRLQYNLSSPTKDVVMMNKD